MLKLTLPEIRAKKKKARKGNPPNNSILLVQLALSADKAEKIVCNWNKVETRSSLRNGDDDTCDDNGLCRDIIILVVRMKSSTKICFHNSCLK